MPNNGCGARDHDDDADTPDQPTCVGYELFNDLTFRPAGLPTYAPIAWDLDVNGFGPGYTGHVKGNGYRIITPTRWVGGAGSFGVISKLYNGGTIEGLGVWNPRFKGREFNGGIVGVVDPGSAIIGSYVYSENSSRVISENFGGGIAGIVVGAKVKNSFVRGVVSSSTTTSNFGGIAGRFQDSGRCINSYVSATLPGPNRDLITINNYSGSSTFSCVGDRTKRNSPATGGAYESTTAAMTAPTDYSGPFADWNRDEDGNPQDVWDFGDETQLPVLKAYGHDITFPRDRAMSGAQTVNLCTRTLPVANEIIRHLKDDTWRTIAPPNAITEVPQRLTTLTPCRSDSDTVAISVNDLRDYVVTTPDNPFSLNPGRTTPASDRVTSLHGNDLAYLVNAAHFDFSNNALSTLPTRMFQGLKIIELDLSNNAITTLHAGTFDGRAAPGQDHDTWIDISENRLTADGIPDRTFDSVSYITGLSLRSNALSAINTRWFENLVNLGRRDPMATSLTTILGLHLGGNEITEHYYWQRAFDNFRRDRVSYEGDGAGATLLAAIKAAMAAANTGANDLDNLDLDSVENVRNSVISSGPCPDALLSGPPGAVDINGDPLPCEEAARWTPPWVVGTSAEVAVPTARVSGPMGHIVISFAHPRPAPGAPPVTGYELRYRQTPDDPSDPWHGPWRIIPVDLSFGSKSATITVLQLYTAYQFQMRTLVGGAPSRATTFAQSTFPEGTTSAAAQQAMAESGRGSVRVTFTHTPTRSTDPDAQEFLAINGYQVRYRPVPTDPEEPWTQPWRDIDVDLTTAGQKSVIIQPLLEGTRYQIQIRPVSDGPLETATLLQGTRLGRPAANSIVPTIREVSVQAGQQIRLEVDVYSRQDTLRNDIADDADSKMLFRWTETPSGGGNFATPSTARRVTYTAPDLPGTYTILAEAQPDGICTSHHASKVGISATDRAPCIATFTVRVSRAPGTAAPPTDPINPAGLIPTSLTDSAGVAYAVFTPVDGGTFTGEGITVSAPEGAVPDQQLIGISATRSDIPVPPPIPGARMTVAGSYYTVNGVQRTGDAPVSGYALDDPIQACMPLPDMFRADISDVVVVNRNPTDGSLAILTSSVQQTPAGLVACGAIGQLPATVAVANVGVIELPPDPPTTTEDELPDTGATAPSTVTTAWTMAVAAAIMAVLAIVGTLREASARARRRRSSDNAV